MQLIKGFVQRKKTFTDILLVSIITIPTFQTLLNNLYYSMHDDQHIARLFLLDQGIGQGTLYPRWVDMLGFGYGYALFNFYPPFIYYVAEVFRSLGFTYIASIKSMIIVGIVTGAAGTYLFTRALTRNRLAGGVAAVLFSYFGYRAVTIYVRGALAEFFALSILPFVLWRLYLLYHNPSKTNAALFGIPLAILIATHPLIAFPTIIYLGLFFLFLLYLSSNRLQFTIQSVIGGLLGLALSAFFWLPSFVERKFTLTDDILLRELARFDIHFIYLQQLWYSPWGFAGSAEGLADGMSFQLGKIYIGIIVLAIALFIIFFTNKYRSYIHRPTLSMFGFIIAMLFFSIFMTLDYSRIVWQNIEYLGYLQFPWRFLSFVNLFIAILGGYIIFGIDKLIPSKKIVFACGVILVTAVILVNTKYFEPQRHLDVTDAERTSFKEIAWRISKTSFEFMPKGIATTTTLLGTTTADITENEITQEPYDIISGSASARTNANTFNRKEFAVIADNETTFQLHTTNFPGWKAFVNNQPVKIADDNDFKLITLVLPRGEHTVRFVFEDTSVRKFAWIISFLALGYYIYWFGLGRSSKR